MAYLDQRPLVDCGLALQQGELPQDRDLLQLQSASHWLCWLANLSVGKLKIDMKIGQ